MLIHLTFFHINILKRKEGKHSIAITSHQSWHLVLTFYFTFAQEKAPDYHSI